MTFLPIVARELRVASRRRSTFWLRTAAALSVLVIGTWFFLMMRRDRPHEISLVLFGLLTGVAVLYCLLSGVRSTADCLSEEKREGTLGLLFLTDLKGYDVVLGKLFATSLNAVYSVLAVVPMLAIPLLLGGVTLGEFGRMALVAINTLFFSLAIGICVSSICRQARHATGATFLVILVFAALLPACGAYVSFIALGRRTVDPAWLLASPGYSFQMAFDVFFRTNRHGFWTSILLIHGLGWAALVLACLIAPRTWQDRPAGVRRLRWRELWQLWSYGNLAERLRFRRRLLDVNAFFWLAARARLKPALVWAVIGLAGCGWAWGWAKFGRDWLNPAIYIATGVVLNLLLKGWVASESGRQLAEDRKHGALELLLSTPLSIHDLLQGQWLALQRQFFGPVVFFVILIIVFIFTPTRDTLGAEDSAAWFSFGLAVLVMLLADLVAIYYVGMWLGLSAKNPNRAASSTVARILVLPWVAYGMVMLVYSLGSMGARYNRNWEPSWQFFLGWWFFLGLATDVVFGLWARQKLFTEFRLAASQRYVPRPGFWRRFLLGAR